MKGKLYTKNRSLRIPHIISNLQHCFLSFLPALLNKLPPFLNKQPKNVLSLQKKSSTRQFESKLSLRSFAFSLQRQPMKVLREPRRRHLLRPRAVTIDDRRRSSIKTQKAALSGSWQSIKLSFTQLTQMGKLKNLKKLEKLKPYALWLNLQPKRLLALTSNDRRESQLEKQRSLAEELGN